METESGCFFSTKDILPSNSWCCRAPGRDGCRNLAQVVLKDVGFVSGVDTWPRKKTHRGIFCESIQKSKWEINILWYLDTNCLFENSLHIHGKGHIYCHRYIQIWLQVAGPWEVPPRLKKHSWGMLWVICCTLFWDISYQWRKGWGVSFGNMPNGRCWRRREFWKSKIFFFGVKNHDE